MIELSGRRWTGILGLIPLVDECKNRFVLLTAIPSLPAKSPVNRHRFPRNKCVCGRREEEHGRIQVIRNTPAGSGDSTQHVGVRSWIFSVNFGQGRPHKPGGFDQQKTRFKSGSMRHIPWANTVDLDSFGSPFIAKSFRHLENRSLGRGIDAGVFVRQKRRNGADVDNLPRTIQSQKLTSEFLT